MKFFYRSFLIVLFLLIYRASFAQYNGGVGGGSAIDLLNYSTCTQTPDSYFAYFGGQGDGTVLDFADYNTCSQTPLSFYAYFGGNGDGVSKDTVNYSICSQTPASFYAYFGGNGDGESMDTAHYSTCTQTPSAYYAYFGGNGDGESIETSNYTNCTQIPLSYYAYFGGKGDGYSADLHSKCVYFVPTAGFTISDSTACTGQTISYTDASINIPFTWEWKFPGGTPSTSNTASPDVVYNTPGTYDVTLKVTNSMEADSITKTGRIVVIASPSTPVITPGGPITFCQGGSVLLTSSAGTGNTWSDSALTQAITVTSSGNYTVTVTGGNGCSSISAFAAVTVNSYPAVPTISANGPASFCQGGNVTLTSSAYTGYTWSNGGTNQSITVTAPNSYSVSLTNAGCSVSSLPFAVTVNPLPPAPSITYTGPVTFCQGGSVIFLSSVSTGNTWSNGQTTQWITVTSSGSYSTTLTVAGCVSQPSSSVIVTVNSIPAAPGTISGSTSVCSGSSNTYSISPVSGAASYIWSLPSGWTGTSVTNSIITAAGSTGGNISVTAENSCGSSSAQTVIAAISGSAPASPGSISGSAAVCSGSSNTYSITAVGDATSYTWTLPIGWTGSSSSNSINATAGSAGGNITVTADNNCGSSAAQIFAVTISGSAPAVPGSISGTAAVCPGSTNTYSITAVSGAASYTWTLPSGWTGSSAANSIITTAGSAGGNISVTADNNCGSSSSQTLNTSVTIVNNAVSQSGASLTANASGAGYQWINCSGNTIIIGQTNQSYAPAVNGNYAVVVTQNGCSDTSACYNVFSTEAGSSASLLSEVIIYPNPSTGVFRVDLNSNGKTSIQIYNVLGKLVYSKETGLVSTIINLSSLAQGIYSLKVVSEKNSCVKQIVISK